MLLRISIAIACAMALMAGCDQTDAVSTSSDEQALGTVNRTCTKDEPMLIEMKLGLPNPNHAEHPEEPERLPALSRACTFDEMCPCGSYCDEATNTCTYECLATTYSADPTQSCAAKPSTTCNLFGR
jgi:hypothetical protein